MVIEYQTISNDICGCVQQSLNQALGGLENQVNMALREQTTMANRLIADAETNLPLQTILDSLGDINAMQDMLFNQAQHFSVNVSMGTSRTISCLQGQITADVGDLLGLIDPYGYLALVGQYASKIEGYMRAALRGFSAQLDLHVDLCGGSAGAYTGVVDALLGQANVGADGRFSVPGFLGGTSLTPDYQAAFGTASTSVQSMSRVRDNLADLPAFGGTNSLNLFR